MDIHRIGFWIDFPTRGLKWWVSMGILWLRTWRWVSWFMMNSYCYKNEWFCGRWISLALQKHCIAHRCARGTSSLAENPPGFFGSSVKRKTIDLEFLFLVFWSRGGTKYLRLAVDLLIQFNSLILVCVSMGGWSGLYPNASSCWRWMGHHQFCCRHSPVYVTQWVMPPPFHQPHPKQVFNQPNFFKPKGFHATRCHFVWVKSRFCWVRQSNHHFFRVKPPFCLAKTTIFPGFKAAFSPLQAVLTRGDLPPSLLRRWSAGRHQASLGAGRGRAEAETLPARPGGVGWWCGNPWELEFCWSVVL